MKLASSVSLGALVLATGTLGPAFVVSSTVQVETTTTTTSGKATKTVQVDRGEVVLVEGNDLVVKMEDGKIRHFPNIPESSRVLADGKALGIHDLKPGMKLRRTITTTTTPRTITTVQKVTGTVRRVTPPLSVILTLEDGKNQEFTIPNGQKFNIDGQMVDAFGLKPGMKVTATKVVETSEDVVTRHRVVTGTVPAPPPETQVAAASPPEPPPADLPILVTVVHVNATPLPEPSSLPKTASELPLFGLLGFLCLSVSVGLKLFASTRR